LRPIGRARDSAPLCASLRLSALLTLLIPASRDEIPMDIRYGAIW
jgi:hypothetical protein